MKKFFVIALGLLIGASTMHAAAFQAVFTGTIPFVLSSPPGSTVMVGDTYTVTVIADNDPGMDPHDFGASENFLPTDVVSTILSVNGVSYAMTTFTGSSYTVVPGLAFSGTASIQGQATLGVDVWELDLDNPGTGGFGTGGFVPTAGFALGNSSLVSLRSIPEPSTLVAFAVLGLAGFTFYRRRRTAADC